MLATHADLILHLRKPLSDSAAYETLLSAIHSEYHGRVVIHQHYELADHYALKGIHFTENDRKTGQTNNQLVSTSFHSLDTARTEGTAYEYFFCSPVFNAISKSGYTTTENWNITQENQPFREKAVALGGIDLSKREIIGTYGFTHVAFHGAVWQTKDPEIALHKLYTTYQP